MRDDWPMSALLVAVLLTQASEPRSKQELLALMDEPAPRLGCVPGKLPWLEFSSSRHPEATNELLRDIANDASIEPGRRHMALRALSVQRSPWLLAFFREALNSGEHAHGPASSFLLAHGTAEDRARVLTGLERAGVEARVAVLEFFRDQRAPPEVVDLAWRTWNAPEDSSTGLGNSASILSNSDKRDAFIESLFGAVDDERFSTGVIYAGNLPLERLLSTVALRRARPARAGFADDALAAALVERRATDEVRSLRQQALQPRPPPGWSLAPASLLSLGVLAETDGALDDAKKLYAAAHRAFTAVVSKLDGEDRAIDEAITFREARVLERQKRVGEAKALLRRSKPNTETHAYSLIRDLAAIDGFSMDEMEALRQRLLPPPP